jgi:hypothetical protein
MMSGIARDDLDPIDDGIESEWTRESKIYMLGSIAEKCNVESAMPPMQRFAVILRLMTAVLEESSSPEVVRRALEILAPESSS